MDGHVSSSLKEDGDGHLTSTMSTTSYLLYHINNICYVDYILHSSDPIFLYRLWILLCLNLCYMYWSDVMATPPCYLKENNDGIATTAVNLKEDSDGMATSPLFQTRIEV